MLYLYYKHLLIHIILMKYKRNSMNDKQSLICEQCSADFTPDLPDQTLCLACQMQADNIVVRPSFESIDQTHFSLMGAVLTDEHGHVEFMPTSLSKAGKRKKGSAVYTARIRRLETKFVRKIHHMNPKKCKACGKKYTPTYSRDFFCPDCSPTPKQKKILNHKRYLINTFNKKIRCYLPKKIFDQINDSFKLFGLKPETFLEICFELFKKHYKQTTNPGVLKSIKRLKTGPHGKFGPRKIPPQVHTLHGLPAEMLLESAIEELDKSYKHPPQVL